MPPEDSANVWRHFCCHSWGNEGHSGCLVDRAFRMLLNILQGTVDSPPIQNPSVPDANGIELEKSLDK